MNVATMLPDKSLQNMVRKNKHVTEKDLYDNPFYHLLQTNRERLLHKDGIDINSQPNKKTQTINMDQFNIGNQKFYVHEPLPEDDQKQLTKLLKQLQDGQIDVTDVVQYVEQMVQEKKLDQLLGKAHKQLDHKSQRINGHLTKIIEQLQNGQTEASDVVQYVERLIQGENHDQLSAEESHKQLGHKSLPKVLEQLQDGQADAKEVVQYVEQMIQENKIDQLLGEIQEQLDHKSLPKDKHLTGMLEQLQDGQADVIEVVQYVEQSIQTTMGSGLQERQQDDKHKQDNMPIHLNGQATIANILLQAKLDLPSILSKMKKIGAKVQQSFENIANGKSLPSQSAKLLQLLQQWTDLAKKLPDSSMIPMNDVGGQKVQVMWQDLLGAFKKRQQLVQSKKYQVNARITSGDVTKWLHSAVKQQLPNPNGKGKTNDIAKQLQMPINGTTKLDKTVPLTGINHTTSMSKLEQYVIHMNQGQQTQSSPQADQTLLDKFSEVLKTSKFLQANGTTQLKITLKPDNLGQIMVKMTQVNGEMAVKILVSSQATKDMLQSHISQLQHLFTPQQVVIERQDLANDNAQVLQDGQQEQQGQPEQDHHEGHSGDESHRNSQQDNEKFLDILNEKV